jgi:YgiT-type zinc finger domain-containing protein
MGSQVREEKKMKCVICKQGETKEGSATVTLEVGKTTLVIKQVPAKVCQNCGEEYVDESVTTQLLKQAKDAANGGVQVDVREYVAA